MIRAHYLFAEHEIVSAEAEDVTAACGEHFQKCRILEAGGGEFEQCLACSQEAQALGGILSAAFPYPIVYAVVPQG